MNWVFPKYIQEEKPRNYSWWIYVLMICLPLLVGIITAVLYKINVPEITTAKFLIIALALPLLIALAMICFCMNMMHFKHAEYLMRDNFFRQKEYQWKCSTRESRGIFAYAMLSPAADLMSGILSNAILEPINEDHCFSLDIQPFDPYQSSYFVMVCKELLNKINNDIKTSPPDKIVINAQGVDENKINQFKSLWKALGFDETPLSHLEVTPVPITRDTVFSKTASVQESTLFIIMNVNQRDNTNDLIDENEFAVAVMFDNSLSSRLRLSVPFSTPIATLRENIEYYIRSGAFNKSNVDTIWIQNLEQALKTELLSILSIEESTKVNDISLYTGKPNELIPWLGFIMGCEALRSGRKGQLLISNSHGILDFSIINNQREKMEGYKERVFTQLSWFNFIGLGAVFSIVTLASSDKIDVLGNPILITLMAICLILGLFALPIRSYLYRKILQQRWLRERKVHEKR